MNSLKIEKYQLDNGLSIILDPRPSELIAGKLRIFHGALSEKEDEKGLAHFFEHTLVTCGTEKYTPDESLELFESFGTQNAYTTLDHLAIIAGFIPSDFEKFLDFASQAAFYPTFNEKRLTLEKEAVLREIGNSKSRANFQDTRDLELSFFGENSPHNYYVLGEEEVIINATPQDMLNFHKRGFYASNSELIISGNLPSGSFSRIKNYFGDTKKGTYSRFKFEASDRLDKKILLHRPAPDNINKDNLYESNADLFILLYAQPVQHEDAQAIEVLSEVLGGSMLSRLFQRVRVKEGLAYNINSGYNGQRNNGYLGVVGQILATKSEQAIDSIFDEFKILREKPINQKEIEAVAKKKHFNFANSFESLSGRLSAIELELDTELKIHEYLQKIDDLSSKEIQRAAQKYLPDENGIHAILLRDPLK